MKTTLFILSKAAFSGQSNGSPASYSPPIFAPSTCRLIRALVSRFSNQVATQIEGRPFVLLGGLIVTNVIENNYGRGGRYDIAIT